MCHLRHDRVNRLKLTAVLVAVSERRERHELLTSIQKLSVQRGVKAEDPSPDDGAKVEAACGNEWLTIRGDERARERSEARCQGRAREGFWPAAPSPRHDAQQGSRTCRHCQSWRRCGHHPWLQQVAGRAIAPPGDHRHSDGHGRIRRPCGQRRDRRPSRGRAGIRHCVGFSSRRPQRGTVHSGGDWNDRWRRHICPPTQ